MNKVRFVLLTMVGCVFGCWARHPEFDKNVNESLRLMLNGLTHMMQVVVRDSARATSVDTGDYIAGLRGASQFGFMSGFDNFVRGLNLVLPGKIYGEDISQKIKEAISEFRVVKLEE